MIFFWDASLRLEVTLLGVTMCSDFGPGAHDPNERVSLTIDMDDTWFNNDDDDNMNGIVDFFDSDINAYNDENDIIHIAIKFESLDYTNGIVNDC